MSQQEKRAFFSQPSDAKAALFFLEGQYQLSYRVGEAEKIKFLSPTQIARAFGQENLDSSWLAANIVRFAQEKRTNKILSFLPAGRRRIFVTNPRAAGQTETGDTTADAILEITVPLPTLLLIGCGQKYWLWATLDQSIAEKSRLCAAPFPNLDSSGGICFGTNVAPECSFDTVEAVWRLILDSPFNNHQTNNRCRTHPNDARKLLVAINGKKTFPKNALIKTEHTVGELWQRVRAN